MLSKKFLSPSFTSLINSHQKMAALLVYLIPFALVTGPFLPDLFLCLVGIYFLVTSYKNKLINYYKNKFVYIFFIFYIYLLLISFFSQEIYPSLHATLFYFRYLFFSLGIWYLFKNVKNFAKNLGISILLATTIVALDGYYEWIFGYNIFGWTANHATRLSGFFRDELIIGGYLARLVPLSFALLLYSFHLTKKNMIIGLFLLVFFSIIIFGSGERAAFLFIMMFSFLIVLLSNNFKFYKLITFTLLILIIALITIYVPHSALKVEETFVNITHNRLLPFAPYSNLHEEHYIVALRMFVEQPIFGQGPNMFPELCHLPKFDFERGCTLHPHNNYIELLAETGIIGVSFLFFTFFIISFLLLKQFLSFFFNYKKMPDYIIFLLILLFTMTWPLIPTGSFYSNYTNVMYYLPVGFVLSYFYDHILK